MAGFWTSGTLKKRMPDIISPYDEKAIESCAYELSVGDESFVTGEASKKQFFKEGETIIIPPGQVALIITKETLKAPTDAIGFLSFKFAAKLRGLINVSGFHVDPGFQGKLVFSMFNAGVQTIHLSVGSRLFMIWFCSLDGATTDSYDGNHKNQLHIPDDAITNLAARMPSPFTLEKDILALRHELRAEIDKNQRILLLVLSLVGALLLASLHSCSQTLWPDKQVAPSAPNSTESAPAAPATNSALPIPPATSTSKQP